MYKEYHTKIVMFAKLYFLLFSTFNKLHSNQYHILYNNILIIFMYCNFFVTITINIHEGHALVI